MAWFAKTRKVEQKQREELQRLEHHAEDLRKHVKQIENVLREFRDNNPTLQRTIALLQKDKEQAQYQLKMISLRARTISQELHDKDSTEALAKILRLTA